MKRSDEVRELLKLTPGEVKEKAGERLMVFATLDELYGHFGGMLADEIEENNRQGKKLKLILPVGPTEQYPVLVEKIKERNISLEKVYFFFMDEYCDKEDKAVPAGHPLSFRGKMDGCFFSRLASGCGLDRGKVVFPSEKNINDLETMIESLGGIDSCYAGLGINGHLAFNEPACGVSATGPRLVEISPETRTINAIRAKAGGNLENFPRTAYTLGMNEILNSRRINIFCRSDIPGIDWANTILRIGLFGEPGDDYPSTHVRGRNYCIFTTEETLKTPENIL